MLAIILTMLVIVVLAGLVLVYVAFPHRGEQLPAAPWLGEVMAKAADAAPTIDEHEYPHEHEDVSDLDDVATHAPAHRR